MMREEYRDRAAGCWARFWQSGRIEDYLIYRNAVSAAADAGEDPHAADDRSPGPQNEESG